MSNVDPSFAKHEITEFGIAEEEIREISSFKLRAATEKQGSLGDISSACSKLPRHHTSIGFRSVEVGKTEGWGVIVYKD